MVIVCTSGDHRAGTVFRVFRGAARLAARASRLGLRPNPYPLILRLPDGQVEGDPKRVEGDEVPGIVVKTPEEIAAERLSNLIHGWTHEIKEIMGGMGINSLESLRGNRLHLCGVGLNAVELKELGIKHAGEGM